MCMEDVRIGRAESVAWSQPNVANGASTIVAPINQKRTRLIFSSASGGCRVHPPGTNAAGSNACFLVGSAVPPLVLRIEDVGNLIRGEWRAGGFGGAADLLVGDVSLEAE